MMPEFNLLDEPFIPVVGLDGSTAEVGLIELFSHLDRIRDIGGDLPTQKFALFRVLLAIVHDAVDITYEDQWADLWESGLPADRLNAYLEGLRDRFWLLHERRPFMQVPGLRSSKGEWSGLEKLVADVPNGLPFLTMRSGTGLTHLTLAEAARWLVHVQAFDPSGIRTGAVGDPDVKGGKGYPIGPAWAGQIGGLIVHRDDLAQSLLLNLVPRSKTLCSDEPDRPVWAHDSPDGPTRRDWEDRTPPGQVSMLTWQSRRVRLIAENHRVVGVVLAQGDKMTPQNRQQSEPMTAWRYSRPQSKKRGQATYMPRKHDPARALWRNLPSIVDPQGQIDGHDSALSPLTVDWIGTQTDLVGRFGRLRVESIGMDYGSQEATIADVIHDELDVSTSVLDATAVSVRAAITDAVACAEETVRHLGRLGADLVQAAGERGDSAGESAGQRATEMAFAALDQPCRSWITGLTAECDPQRALAEWQQIVVEIATSIARDLLDEAPPAAIIGRDVRGYFLNAARAEGRFRRRLREALPHAIAFSHPPHSLDLVEHQEAQHV